jgi:hypothetical protein
VAASRRYNRRSFPVCRSPPAVSFTGPPTRPAPRKGFCHG